MAKIEPVGRDGDESHNFLGLWGNHPSGNLVSRCGHGKEKFGQVVESFAGNASQVNSGDDLRDGDHAAVSRNRLL